MFINSSIVTSIVVSLSTVNYNEFNLTKSDYKPFYEHIINYDQKNTMNYNYITTEEFLLNNRINNIRLLLEIDKLRE